MSTQSGGVAKPQQPRVESGGGADAAGAPRRVPRQLVGAAPPSTPPGADAATEADEDELLLVSVDLSVRAWGEVCVREERGEVGVCARVQWVGGGGLAYNTIACTPCLPPTGTRHRDCVLCRRQRAVVSARGGVGGGPCARRLRPRPSLARPPTPMHPPPSRVEPSTRRQLAAISHPVLPAWSKPDVHGHQLGLMDLKLKANPGTADSLTAVVGSRTAPGFPTLTPPAGNVVLTGRGASGQQVWQVTLRAPSPAGSGATVTKSVGAVLNRGAVAATTKVALSFKFTS